MVRVGSSVADAAAELFGRWQVDQNSAQTKPEIPNVITEDKTITCYGQLFRSKLN